MLLTPVHQNPKFLFYRDLKILADNPHQHNLHQSDQSALEKAAKTIFVNGISGQLSGLGAGLYLYYRFRRGRGLYAVSRGLVAANQPASELAQFFKELLLTKSRFGAALQYGFYGVYVGSNLGGKTGLWLGTYWAMSELYRDEERRMRILEALRASKASSAEGSLSVSLTER